MNFSQIPFGFFTIKVYGLFLGIAFFVFAYNFYKGVTVKKLSINFFIHHFWRWVLGACIFGRLFALILNFELFEVYGIFSFLAFWDGLSFAGILFGFFSVFLWDLKRAGEDSRVWLDVLVFPVLYGLFILNLGAFFTGAIFGTETALPWGIQYETFRVNNLNPLHPVSLYFLVFYLFTYLWIRENLLRFDRGRGGKRFFSFFLFYLLGTFVLYFFRGDLDLLFGIISFDQLFFILSLFGLFGFLYREKKTT